MISELEILNMRDTLATLQAQVERDKYAEKLTVHDHYTLAALAGIITNDTYQGEGWLVVVAAARACADEAMRQREDT